MGERPIRIRLGSGRRLRDEKFLDGRLAVRSARGVQGPERVLLDALDQPLEGRVLAAGLRDAAVAAAAARLYPAAEVHCFSLDAYEHCRLRRTLAANRCPAVRLHLGADLPAGGPFDWVLLAPAPTGDARLSGEILRGAHRVLRTRGKLLAATDNARDRWLHDRIVEVFGAVTIHRRGPGGRVYIARKTAGKGSRPRDFRRSFTARLFGREVRLETRPGVFSHGEIDQGTLALAEVAGPAAAGRILDLGCGSGALGIAAALAAPESRALLVDANARAAACARANVLRNGAAGRALVLLACDLAAVRDASFDLVLANPPYFSDYRISEQFARDACRVLAPGGSFLLVTKSPGPHAAIFDRHFGTHEVIARRGYAVLRATKSRGTPTRLPACAP